MQATPESAPTLQSTAWLFSIRGDSAARVLSYGGSWKGRVRSRVLRGQRLCPGGARALPVMRGPFGNFPVKDSPYLHLELFLGKSVSHLPSRLDSYQADLSPKASASLASLFSLITTEVTLHVTIYDSGPIIGIRAENHRIRHQKTWGLPSVLPLMCCDFEELFLPFQVPGVLGLFFFLSNKK